MKIELRGVLKSYRSTHALDHVSLVAESGQIITLLGPNGERATMICKQVRGSKISVGSGGVVINDAVVGVAVGRQTQANLSV